MQYFDVSKLKSVKKIKFVTFSKLAKIRDFLKFLNSKKIRIVELRSIKLALQQR